MRFCDSNWTIPNLLTVLRVLMTPAFAAFFLQGRHVTALFVFAAAGLTDALDGTLARVLKQRSRLGAMLDPLADKILLVTAFICLAAVSWLPPWIAVVVVSRDVIIVGGLAVLSFWGADIPGIIRPSLVSKLNTTAQMLLILATFAHRAVSPPLVPEGLVGGLTVTVAGLCLVSGGHYILKWFGLFDTGEEGGGPGA